MNASIFTHARLINRNETTLRDLLPRNLSNASSLICFHVTGVPPRHTIIAIIIITESTLSKALLYFSFRKTSLEVFR